MVPEVAGGMDVSTLAIVAGLVALVGTVFWCIQIIDLMGWRDEDFPAKHDKVLWLIVLLLTNLVGAIAFVFWKWWDRTEAGRGRN